MTDIGTGIPRTTEEEAGHRGGEMTTEDDITTGGTKEEGHSPETEETNPRDQQEEEKHQKEEGVSGATDSTWQLTVGDTEKRQTQFVTTARKMGSGCTTNHSSVGSRVRATTELPPQREEEFNTSVASTTRRRNRAGLIRATL